MINIKKLSKFIAISSVILGIIGPTLPVSAAGASISLVANKATVSNGGSLIVAVYMNGGGNPINAVEADLNYPASKLQYVGLSYSGGAFAISTPSNGGGNGAVSIQNGSVSPVSGSALVATVTFKALSSSGSASIGVSGSSSLISATTNANVPHSSSGVSVNFGSVVASSGSTNTTQASTPAPPKDSTSPTITDIKVTNLTPYSATISWTTNEASDSVVEYGLDSMYGLSASTKSDVTAHFVNLNSSFLTPESLLHYRVKSTDSSGNVGTSLDQNFQLPGVDVVIVVRGADGKPLAGAVVTLDNATGTTNAKGQVTIPSSLGVKKITTVYQGVTIQKPITVTKSTKPLPPYQLDLSRQPLNGWMMTSIGLVFIILVLLGIDALLFGSHFFAKLSGLHKLQPKPEVAKSTLPDSQNITDLPKNNSSSPAQNIDDIKPPQPAPPDKTSSTVDNMMLTSEPVKQQISVIETPSATESSQSAEIAPRLKKPAHRKHRAKAGPSKPAA